MHHPIETQQHTVLRDAIWAKLGEWRRFVLAVDGVDAAGKSRLARYLAWQLGIPAVETDLFLIGRSRMLAYRVDDLTAVLTARLDLNRPVIVEGVRVLNTLRTLGLNPDYLVWVEQEGWSGGRTLSRLLSEYRTVFAPVEKADFVFRWSADLED